MVRKIFRYLPKRFDIKLPLLRRLRLLPLQFLSMINRRKDTKGWLLKLHPQIKLVGINAFFIFFIFYKANMNFDYQQRGKVGENNLQGIKVSQKVSDAAKVKVWYTYKLNVLIL